MAQVPLPLGESRLGRGKGCDEERRRRCDSTATYLDPRLPVATPPLAPPPYASSVCLYALGVWPDEFCAEARQGGRSHGGSERLVLTVTAVFSTSVLREHPLESSRISRYSGASYDVIQVQRDSKKGGGDEQGRNRGSGGRASNCMALRSSLLSQPW